MIASIVQYIKEVGVELKKVSWPTKKETIRLSLVVVIVSAVVGLYLGALDYVFNEALKLVVSK